MPQIEFTEKFLREYERLDKRIKKTVQKQLRLLAEDPTHLTPRSKTIAGAKGISAARIDVNYWITFERLPGDRLLLRLVGPQDEALKNT